MTNTSEKIYSINFVESIVQAVGKQIRFEEFIYDNAVIAKNNNTSWIDILPGSTINIGIWVGVEESDVSEISQIQIYLHSPFYERSDGNWMSVGGSYLFTVDLTDWGFEPMLKEITDNLY